MSSRRRFVDRVRDLVARRPAATPARPSSPSRPPRTTETLDALRHRLDTDTTLPDDPRALAQWAGRALTRALAPSTLNLLLRRAVRFRSAHAVVDGATARDRGASGDELMPAGLGLTDAVWAAGGLLDVARAGPTLAPRALAWLDAQGADHVLAIAAESTAAESTVADSTAAESTVAATVGLLLLGALTDSPDEVDTPLRATCSALGRRLSAALEASMRAQRAARRPRRLEECPTCGRCFDCGTLLCPDDDTELEPTLSIERLLAGRYVLERRLGKGGMGFVYAAFDQRDEVAVAIKMRSGSDDLARGRFAKEAEVGAVLDHPAIARLLGHGHVETGGGRAGDAADFLVMELVSGETLRERIERGPAEPARLAGWLEPVLDGIAHAHAQGVLHRDLKPENIMLVHPDTPGEQAKILDFGLARRLDIESSLTGAGVVLGTLAYMSPEQLASERLDPSSDQYSLAVIVAEALCGRLPFPGRTMGELLRALAQDSFDLATTSTEQEQVAAVLRRAAARDRDARWPSVQHFGAELLPALRGCPPFATPPEA
ncbi:MAG: serine/threonine-protein kinase [Acidobacteriota bacterium]